MAQGTSAVPQSATGALDVVFIADSSGSTWRATGDGPATDPAPRPIRIELARLAAALAGVDAGGAIDRVGYIAFGAQADRDHRIPLTPLVADAARRAFISDAQRITVDLGATSYTAALRAAIELIEESDPAYRIPPYRADGRALAILFASDGRPQLDLPGIDQDQLRELAAPGGLYEQLRVRGWSIDAVGFGPAAEPGENSDVLKQMAQATGGRYHPAASAAELLPIYTQVISAATGRQLAPPRPPAHLPTTQIFNLPADLAAATFTVLAGADGVAVNIVRPDGRVTNAGDADITEARSLRFIAITLRDPVEGPYKVLINGDGVAYADVVVRARPAPVATAIPTELPAVQPTLVIRRDDPPNPATTQRATTIPLPGLLAALAALVLLPVAWRVWRVRRAAAASGWRLAGAEREPALWTDLPWDWRSPLRPRLALRDAYDAWGIDAPDLASHFSFTPEGPKLEVAEPDGVEADGLLLRAGAAHEVRPGDRITSRSVGATLEIVAVANDAAD